MKSQVFGIVGSLVLAGTCLMAGSVAAQDRTVKDGVFTAEQSAAGKAVYEKSCKNCHDIKYYEGTLKSYNAQPLLYLWENMFGTMPADNPGSLAFEEYTNVLAFILSEYGFPAGDTLLDPDKGMDKIKIVAP